jgi:hypothetical protein
MHVCYFITRDGIKAPLLGTRRDRHAHSDETSDDAFDCVLVDKYAIHDYSPARAVVLGIIRILPAP